MSFTEKFRLLLADLSMFFENSSHTDANEKIVCGRKEYVLEADLHSQSKLIGLAKEYFKDYEIISEELDNYTALSFQEGNFIIMDPLDGTHNYLYGLPMWGVSFAVISNGEVIECYIGIPMFDILLQLHNNKVKKYKITNHEYCEEISVKETALDISDQMIAYDNQFYKDVVNSKNHYSDLVDNAFTTRISGSSVFDIAMIVLGRLNARIWHNVEIYDVIPAFGFLKKNGFVLNLYKGTDASLKTRAILCTTDSTLYQQLEKINVTKDYMS